MPPTTSSPRRPTTPAWSRRAADSCAWSSPPPATSRSPPPRTWRWRSCCWRSDRGSGDGDDRLDLDRHAEGQLAGADGRSRVASRVAPEAEDEVAEAVDGGRRGIEALRAADEAEGLDPGGHAVEVAELLLERGEDRQAGGAGGVVGLLDGHLGAHATGDEQPVAVERTVARHIGQAVVDPHQLERQLD